MQPSGHGNRRAGATVAGTAAFPAREGDDPMSETAKEGPALSATVQEVQGWFPSNAAIQGAIGALSLARYDRSDFSVPEEAAFANPQGATVSDLSEAPQTPIDHQQIRTMNTGMATYAGATIAAGLVLGTGGAAAPAVIAAAAAGLGAAGVSTGIGAAADQAQVAEYDRRGAAGTLVLAVHVEDQAQAGEVVRLMRENGATETKVVTRADEAVTAGVSASGWTG